MNTYDGNIYDSFNLLSETSEGISFLNVELTSYIESKYNISSYGKEEYQFKMLNGGDSRNQGGNHYIENFILHMNNVFNYFQDKYNSEIKDFYYCYGEIPGLREKSLASKTIIGFNDFILNYAGKHTIFYGYIVLSNGIIIQVNTSGTTYFNDYLIYTPKF